MVDKNKSNFKCRMFFIAILSLITIAFVKKTFQNDTFFNISIGKYILQNGIDMKEHFSWIPNLYYTYSHWAFDILVFFIYSKYYFAGIYIFTIVLSIIINATLFSLLYKRTNNSIISFLITFVSFLLNIHYYSARSQIISFICFIIEIYCLERFVETNQKKYGLFIIIIGIVIANFHAATWPLMFVLFLPYFGAAFIKVLSPKSLYTIMLNRAQKKLKNLPTDSLKRDRYESDVKYYTKFLEEEKQKQSYKIIIKDNYNIKNLITLMILVAFTGLLTPIKDVPYTYILKSMFRTQQFR